MALKNENHILVLGAGTLGLPILQHLTQTLLTNPQPVRTTLSVTLRPSNSVFASPTTQDTSPSLPKPHPLTSTLRDLLTHHNITPIPIDLHTASPANLITLFKSYTTIIGATGYSITSSSSSSSLNFPLKIARAVLAAHVPRFIPWAFGLDYPAIGRGSSQKLFDVQLDVRELLEAQSETVWTVVQVGAFSDFFGESWWGVVDVARPLPPSFSDPTSTSTSTAGEEGGGNGTLRALGDWDTEITLTTPNDIGRGVALILFPPPPSSSSPSTSPSESPHANTTIKLSTATTTYTSLFSTIHSLTARTYHHERWSVPHLDQQYAETGDGIAAYRAVFARGVGTAWPRSECLDLGPEADAERGVEGIVGGWVGGGA